MIPPHRTSQPPSAKTMLQWQRVLIEKLERLAETQPRAAAIFVAAAEKAIDILAADTKGGA